MSIYGHLYEQVGKDKFKELVQESIKVIEESGIATKNLLNESCYSFERDRVKIKINSISISVPVKMDEDYNKKDDPEVKKRLDEMYKRVPSIVKLIEGDALWNYLYNSEKDYYESEINNDPYFDGKTIKSGKDLKNSIKTEYKMAIIIDNYYDCTYFCGEYWVDPEHGFAITFPHGKFIKAQNRKYRDKNWKPIATYIGQFDEAL